MDVLLANYNKALVSLGTVSQELLAKSVTLEGRKQEEALRIYDEVSAMVRQLSVSRQRAADLLKEMQ